MANHFGYNQLFTDRPEVWFTGGKVAITDGYGTPSWTDVPSGIVDSVVRDALGTYTVSLKQCWYALLDVHVASECASIVALSQLVSDTVGSTSAGGPGQALQGVTFKFVDAAGSDVELPSGDSFRFTLTLKKSSA